MTPRPACSAMGLDRERLGFWLARGCTLERDAGVWRLEAPVGSAPGRGPAPTPVPERLAREAIAAGARVSYADDLLARAA